MLYFSEAWKYAWIPTCLCSQDGDIVGDVNHHGQGICQLPFKRTATSYNKPMFSLLDPFSHPKHYCCEQQQLVK